MGMSKECPPAPQKKQQQQKNQQNKTKQKKPQQQQKNTTNNNHSLNKGVIFHETLLMSGVPKWCCDLVLESQYLFSDVFLFSLIILFACDDNCDFMYRSEVLHTVFLARDFTAFIV